MGEATLTKIEEYDVALAEITQVDLQDPTDGSFADLAGVPDHHVWTSAILPLRCCTILYGLRPDKEPMSLILEAPAIPANSLIEEMVQQGVVKSKVGQKKKTGVHVKLFNYKSII